MYCRSQHCDTSQQREYENVLYRHTDLLNDLPNLLHQRIDIKQGNRWKLLDQPDRSIGVLGWQEKTGNERPRPIYQQSRCGNDKKINLETVPGNLSQVAHPAGQIDPGNTEGHLITNTNAEGLRKLSFQR